ncbi:MAG TPA: cupin domain-containing protein [Gemmatimonas sp.]|nr:cupin domain-containing protein [Gemmatimonas sp.]
MTTDDSRRRPRPSERFAGPENMLDTRATLRALRSEASAGTNGHRQITLLHEGPVRLVLFAFDAGGRMPEHKAPGWVTIQVVRGALRVRTSERQHTLAEGQILALAPGVLHDVEATEEADMLLGIYPEAPVNSSASPP